MSVRIFLREAPAKLLIALLDGGTTKTKLWRKTGIAYSHLLKLINDFVELGIVEENQRGRAIFVSLTEEGMHIAKLVKKVNDFFQNLKADH
jgi:predicted transcriptional regulator